MNTDSNHQGESAKDGSTARQILLSLSVVAICWVFLKFGGLIVASAISHIWDPYDSEYLAYCLLFRQIIMTFLYPSFLKVFRPAFMPLYNEVKEEEGADAAREFARGAMSIGMIMGLLIFAVLWTFPSATVRFFGPGLGPEDFLMSVQLMRQMAPGILCLLSAEMYLMAFHAEKRFGFPHGAEAAQKISWGIMIFVVGKLLNLGLLAIGWTYTVSCVLMLIIDVVGMRRNFGWALVFTHLGRWTRKWGKRAGLLALPLVVGIVAARFRDLLTIRIQSQLDTLRFTSVEQARQLTNLPLVFIGQIVSIVMLPHLASILHSEGGDAHRRTLQNTVETLCLAAIPIVSVTLIMAPELISLVYIGPHWEPSHFAGCRQAALAMRMISIALILMMLENILLPGLFSIKSMWWPILWGLAASSVQIMCLWGLASLELAEDSTMLLLGVALIYPMGRVLKNSILFIVLRKKTGIFPGGAFVSFLVRILLLAGGTVGVTYLGSLGARFLLPAIPKGESVGFVPYKLTIVGHLTVATIITFAGFAGMVVLAGYRDRALRLIRTLLKRQPESVEE